MLQRGPGPVDRRHHGDHPTVGVEADVRLGHEHVAGDHPVRRSPPGEVAHAQHDLVGLAEALLRLVDAEDVRVDALRPLEDAIALGPWRPLLAHVGVPGGAHVRPVLQRDARRLHDLLWFVFVSFRGGRGKPRPYGGVGEGRGCRGDARVALG